MTMETKKQSYWWWFESHNTPHKSKWLQTTLAELDQKTKGMLKLIDEDADSFAQRAEMYYKKRPELVSMVEDFYRAHRSLAEQYEQLKNNHGTPVTSPPLRYPSSPKSPLQRSSLNLYKRYDAYSPDPYGLEESGDSEVDDPEDTPVSKGDIERAKLMEEVNRLREENELKYQMILREGKAQQELRARLAQKGVQLRKMKEEKEKHETATTLMRMKLKERFEETTRLRDEIETLREENLNHKEQLKQKDEEKREVIRQLSVAIEMLREENLLLKKSRAKQTPEKQNPIEAHRFNGFVKLFNLLPKSQTSIVPL